MAHRSTSRAVTIVVLAVAVLLNREATLMAVVGIAVEWAIVRAFLRKSVRGERGLAVLVALANVISYPLALAMAHGLVFRRPKQAFLSAEAAAVVVEFLLYVVVLHAFPNKSPLSPDTSRPRIFAATVTANVATAMLAVAYSGVRAGR